MSAAHPSSVLNISFRMTSAAERATQLSEELRSEMPNANGGGAPSGFVSAAPATPAAIDLAAERLSTSTAAAAQLRGKAVKEVNG